MMSGALRSEKDWERSQMYTNTRTAYLESNLGKEGAFFPFVFECQRQENWGAKEGEAHASLCSEIQQRSDMCMVLCY